MRSWIIALSALGLAACGSDPAPTPDGPDTAAEAEVDASLVTLKGDGLIAGAEAFYFAAGKAEVTTALTRVLGEPQDVMDMAECGAGPMQSASFADGLVVNFQDEKLVGWFLRSADEQIVFTESLGIGLPRAELEALGGYAPDPESTLGEEFYNESAGIGGFIGEDGKVSELYAGTQCFFR